MPPNNPSLRSFIDVAADSPFPIQNLPYGIFGSHADRRRRVGVAIGNFVLDLAALEDADVLEAAPRGQYVFDSPTLNLFMRLGPEAWRETRRRLSELLRHDTPTLRDDAALLRRALVPMAEVKLYAPVHIADTASFEGSREHAMAAAALADPPPPPADDTVPSVRLGRSGCVAVAGDGLVRPLCPRRPATGTSPGFGPSLRLDFEAGTAFIVGQAGAAAQPLSSDEAENRIFGVVLACDWIARDSPAPPWAGTRVATSISPWVVPLEALAPFRCAGPSQDPRPLAHLAKARGDPAYDIDLEVSLRPADAAAPYPLSRTNARHSYWSMVQQLIHWTAGGPTRVGDLLCSGALSGPSPNARASLAELTDGGARPMESGEARRSWLEDGDEVIVAGSCRRDAYRLGFGELRARILPPAAPDAG